MPVIATPISTPSDDLGCSSQGTVQPNITQLYGVQIPTKRRAVIFSQGQIGVVSCQLLNGLGNPINLTDCNIVDGDDESVVIKIKESINPSAVVYTIDGTVVTADDGSVEFNVPSDVVNDPGVYQMEVAIIGDEEMIAFSNKFYLWIDRGLFGTPKHPHRGPPTLDEVRMFIRDNGPEENLLLDDFEFDLAEVCQATENAVRYWNEVNPDVGLYFNTTTYCARYKWLQAIAGHMMTVAAHRFRRNHLPYQAAGISIDDQNKFQQYDQTGMMLTQEYKEWVKTKKVELNCYRAMTSSGSSYGAFAFQLLNTGV